MNVADEIAQELADTTKRQHVVPEDGHKHTHSADCWCKPEPMEDLPLIYVHNPYQQGSALLQ